MGTLILVRHGQSIWNLQNRFTGWIDISLSEKGVKEAQNAGNKLKKYKFNAVFTSNLLRAEQTLFQILYKNENHKQWIRIHENKPQKYDHFTKNNEDKNLLKIYYTEKLNERFYGNLQGLNKEKTAKKYGLEQVQIWRRSYKTAPPGGDSLYQTLKITIPYYKEIIEPLVRKNNTVLITAHGNSLRSIIKELENISDEEISNHEIKTGIPYVYEINNKGKVTSKQIL